MIAMKMTTVEAKAAVKETNRMMSFLPFIDDDEDVAFIDDEEVERPATTRSGRAITRRSEIDFSLFFF